MTTLQLFGAAVAFLYGFSVAYTLLRLGRRRFHTPRERRFAVLLGWATMAASFTLAGGMLALAFGMAKRAL